MSAMLSEGVVLQQCSGPLAQPCRVMSTSVGYAAVEFLSELRTQTEVLLRQWQVDTETMEAVVLSLSELYTNVVEHVPGGPCTVALRLTTDVLRLTVHDTSERVPAVPGLCPGDDDESGRGLFLVAAYADTFHFVPDQSRFRQGKTAVAEWAA